MANSNSHSTRPDEAVGVSFEPGGKVYYFKAAGVTIEKGCYVLTETERGIDIGEVVFPDPDIAAEEADRDLKPLLRRATKDDLLREQVLKERERKAAAICERKIQEHGLPMKLIKADYTFDGQRLIFFFSANNRVDFRALVRDLASTFDCRIELRQIGVRDEAKMMGALGPCGRPLCCSRWMRDFEPVPIKLAKQQGMSLNPAKISGLCNRLMCCLRFERKAYTELAERMPEQGDEVRGQGRTGRITSVNLLQQTATVKFDDDKRPNDVEVQAGDLRRADSYWRLIGTHWPQRISPPPIPSEEEEEEDDTDQDRGRAENDQKRTRKQPRKKQGKRDRDAPQVIMREPQRRKDNSQRADAHTDRKNPDRAKRSRKRPARRDNSTSGGKRKDNNR